MLAISIPSFSLLNNALAQRAQSLSDWSLEWYFHTKNVLKALTDCAVRFIPFSFSFLIIVLQENAHGTNVLLRKTLTTCKNFLGSTDLRMKSEEKRDLRIKLWSGLKKSVCRLLSFVWIIIYKNNLYYCLDVLVKQWTKQKFVSQHVTNQLACTNAMGAILRTSEGLGIHLSGYDDLLH